MENNTENTEESNVDPGSEFYYDSSECEYEVIDD